MSLSAVIGQGRLVALEALRDVLAEQIDMCEAPRDVAPLSRQLMDVLEQIDVVRAAEPEKKGSPLDELQNRRAARKPGAARRQGA